MATPADKAKGGKAGFTFRMFKDGDQEWPSIQSRIFTADETDKCPVYVHKTPPCQASCPSGEDIRGWLNIVRGIEKPPKDVKWQEYAFQRSTDANPFPSMMGRVCPAPCQTGCNRNAVEDYVGINAVEQFIGDWALANNVAFKPAEQSTGKKVAIIGGGPAGLAAAYQLRRQGHAVTLFDDHDELGGMAKYGVPGYRLPRESLDGEINRIVNMGVEVKLKTRVGVDVPLKDLEKQFDAVLFAIGCKSGRALPVPGADAPNCITGIAFLEAFNQGRLKAVSGRVIVIGGGDTSIDVVSVARRLGYIKEMAETERPEYIVMGQTAHDVAVTARKEGAEVMLISRQPVEKMNAAKHEIEDAQREGVAIRGSVQPVKVILDDKGRAKALRVVELDFSGGKPVEKPGTEQDLKADLIVSAIGQMGDFRGLEDFNNGKGLINADKFYQVPGKPGCFVCGDIIRPHLLTTVIGQGSIAADSIDHYLKKQEMGKRPKVDVHHFNLLAKLQEVGLTPKEFKPAGPEGERPIDRGLRGTYEQGKAVGGYAIHNYENRADAEVCQSNELFLGHFQYTPRLKRTEMVPDADEVLGHFKERMLGLDEKQTVEEAKRCMSCGLCFECDNCVIYCPQIAVKRTPKSEATMGRYVYTDYDLCIGCHICADVCPAGYIKMGMGDH
ncbi:MAG: glutamate synthase [Candidatus Muproteobacteria bacterium RIFCSPHIGHO2_12_FULL_60_33]|uniref:Glutamate synthase n=1 Tax=Candidatus Muproteobacteria bacterium RIFCSPLOWO2_01_FULL_60_18 TaxID=1817768 RepID=A0A1F6TY85_9PROT|nr:MAG: glutamate synthase [Candidatus Muproteobacteria bacterium RIFCSPLOWO2_01_FULL_60_18]OGI55112.1 MAG: glutamate synthase [Candidatus Muproteobacteria bacterium RIFCSPHIGHO2_12_FULL_60_33]OGI56109.1 MAG: glutamate synthase [Candidatus Muproteobacteria bacterium RIFCSPHIGHO2_02_FULL_60_13]OGI57755.1 MAG: glutamate synthase [Candidatus Muproteobacteria bacterium RIFCSPHIGHO2_01_FULL_61_200]